MNLFSLISRNRKGTRFIGAMALLATFLVSNSNAQIQDSAPALGTRARDFAFYGTNFSDWAVVDNGAAGQPIVWKILKNPADPAPGQARIAQFSWGVVGDAITPGSWTGDGTYDPGIWRLGTGYWNLRMETPTLWDVTSWGTVNDNPGREGDYDGDGRFDPTVVRISGGVLQWWMRLSGSGQLRVVPFGTTATNQSTFAFRGADFTGDGRDELVVARANATNGNVIWWVGDAVTGTQLMEARWGNFNTQYLINPADYTGDGRADLVTWAAGEPQPLHRYWYIFNPATGQALPNVLWGIGDTNFVNNDLPIRGDYDGDNIHDRCVWRPSTATYYCLASSNGSMIVQQWGAPNDTPLGTFFTF